MTPRVTFYDVPPDGRWPLIVFLAEAARAKGTRMLVHCADVGEARALDAHLWTYRDEAFMPHEIANDASELGDSEAQLVIITAEGRPIDATVLVQLTPASEAFVRGFQTVIDVVDHRDEQLLLASRQRYRLWREAGVPLSVKQR